jgi:hypothetical protein
MGGGIFRVVTAHPDNSSNIELNGRVRTEYTETLSVSQ